MASDGDHNNNVYGEEDLDEDDDDDSEDDANHRIAPRNDNVYEEEDDDVDIDDDDSTSSSNLAAGDGHRPPQHPHPLAISNPAKAPSEVTIAVAGVPIVAIGGDSLPGPKSQRVDDVSIAAMVEEKRPVPVPLDDSRRLFQRLWTDEDEIELLQGFLEYTTQRGVNNSSSHHLDTSAFYDQVKAKLQLDFNKNQLVEKLRRLKKKYRNVLDKLGSGKDFVFKSQHDQATFEISQKIWCLAAAGRAVPGGGGVEEGGLDDEDANTNPNISSIDHNHYGGIDVNNSSDKKVQRSRKRSRAIKVEEKPVFYTPQPQQQPAATPTTPTAASIPAATPSIPVLIEDTVRSCLSPLFKELLHNAMNGSCVGSRGFGLPLNPIPLGFAGQINFNGGDLTDERWRKQHILELEVYSKRLELVQDQIKSQLEELRSMGS